MTLSKAITEFIREIKAAKSPATAAAYESDLRRMAKHARLDTVLHFTPALLRAYFEWESSQGARMSTLHRKQAAVRVFARWLVDNQVIYREQDPTLMLTKIRRPETLPRPFTRDEVTRLWSLELIDHRERLLRALLFFTGLRVTPICTIRLGDIGERPPTIRVVNKSRREQLVHLHPVLAELMLSHVLSRTDLKPSTPLLVNDEGRPYRRKSLEAITRAWGAHAKVRDCTPHRFRHTFATRLLEQEKDLRIVQEALGHRDIKSTTLYTQVTTERLQGAVGRLSYDEGS